MKKIFLVIVLSLFVGVTLYSQDSISVVRIAYINRAEILESFPQVVSINKELEKMELDYEAEFIVMAKDYERKIKSYLEQNKQMSEPIKLARQSEITELEVRMEMYKKRYKEELDKFRQEKYAIINQLLDEAISLVCQREKITILFDQAQPLYMSSQCVDLTSLVKSELGL